MALLGARVLDISQILARFLARFVARLLTSVFQEGENIMNTVYSLFLYQFLSENSTEVYTYAPSPPPHSTPSSPPLPPQKRRRGLAPPPQKRGRGEGVGWGGVGGGRMFICLWNFSEN